MSDILEFLMFFLVAILVVAVLVGGIAAGISYGYCHQLELVNSDQELDWNFWTGCLIYAEEEELWVRYDDYMNFLGIRGEIDN